MGSGLAGRNLLYERFYLTSASRNRIIAHANNADRSRPDALVDGILAAGRGASRREVEAGSRRQRFAAHRGARRAPAASSRSSGARAARGD